MLAIACACALFVMLAMLIDLISGLYKAKLRGELRTSYGLSGTPDYSEPTLSVSGSTLMISRIVTIT